MASIQVLHLAKPKPDKHTLVKSQGLQIYQQHRGMQNSAHPSFRALLTHPSASQMTPVFAQVTHTSPPLFAAIIVSQQKQKIPRRYALLSY